jgi:hypothetical protein
MLSLFNAPKGLVGTPTADMTAVVVVRLQNIATDASSPTVPVNLTAVLGKAVGESDTIRWVLWSQRHPLQPYSISRTSSALALQFDILT